MARDRLFLFQFCNMGRRDKSCSPALRQRLATERWLAKPGIRDSQNAKARLRVARNRAKKLQMQPPAEPNPRIPGTGSPPLDYDNISHDSRSDCEDDRSYDFPYDAEQQSAAAIASPPLNDFPYDAEQQPAAAIASPPLNDFSYEGEQQPVPAIASPPLNDFSYDAETSFDDFSYEGDDSVLTMDNDLPCSCDVPTLQTIENTVRQWRKEWESESAWNEAFDDELGRARIEGEHATTTFLDECAQRIIDGKELLESIHDVVRTHCPYCRERLKYDGILLYDLLVCVVSQVKFFEVKLDTGCN
ncbi:uncharacterized protein F5891DRAFT_1194787 [Suillus fuscotomentosus]|uniref:Uncharacterized protein n=1 Tax=Suillus fuscotomentosus TaxID=1912939 RepID=A0AAD4DVM4_9AGAM|nr:uncharacterized protein F5891DRAFT_1194787 [Suillus fuscotomentosus]KAG1894802.1 hypothetical protein F5891DRAFT_1194787 [Suillus fuscotomentosus]